jgi:predicted flap endonuclease-1-like 5' DNA nuclease
VKQFRVDDSGGADDAVRPEGERLQAALEALTARDQVLADRSRRLAALEGAASRLTALAARLELAEAELAALRRARSAEAREREERIGQLEARLAELPLPAEAPAPLRSSEEPPEGVVARLQQDLDLERRRNARLAARREDGAGAVARLQEELDTARRHAATLERQLGEMQQAAGPSGAYAHWEQWFHQRLADRAASDSARADEALRQQRAALEEKERLISRLIDRLRATGQIRQGPDDLKEVVGVGPVLEDLLHGLGITSFEQLAALSEEEVGRIEGLLGVFPERIRRDRWIEQAADLAARRVRLGPGLSLT